MEPEQAIQILETLAGGTDPVTGEVFAFDSPYNHPTIIRAMYCVLRNCKLSPKKRKTKEQRQTENLATGLPRNAGMPWTGEMLDELTEQYNAEVRPKDLAAKYERTEGSILAQLSRLGVIKEQDRSRYYP